jgi:F-box protein 9
MFGGIYKRKEKYLKRGARAPHELYDPFHMIQYYRYLRFMPNGSAYQVISVKKIESE